MKVHFSSDAGVTFYHIGGASKVVEGGGDDRQRLTTGMFSVGENA